MDFTFNKYEEILQTIGASNYKIFTVEGYLRKGKNEKRALVIRHDVDAKPQRALAMADMEENYGVQATYYFRTIPTVFNEKIISLIHNKNHEIGYHYEAMDMAKGDIKEAYNIIENDLKKFDKICKINTICMHGNSFTKWDNRDLWKIMDFRDLGILGEAYLSMDFKDMIYLSDSSRSWRKKYKIKDIYENMSMEEPRNSDKLCKIIEKEKFNTIYLLVHPDQWSSNRLYAIIDSIYYLVTNQIKLIYNRAYSNQ